jgi:hypothetical protein
MEDPTNDTPVPAPRERTIKGARVVLPLSDHELALLAVDLADAIADARSVEDDEATARKAGKKQIDAAQAKVTKIANAVTTREAEKIVTLREVLDAPANLVRRYVVADDGSETEIAPREPYREQEPLFGPEEVPPLPEEPNPENLVQFPGEAPIPLAPVPEAERRPIQTLPPTFTGIEAVVPGEAVPPAQELRGVPPEAAIPGYADSLRRIVEANPTPEAPEPPEAPAGGPGGGGSALEPIP